MEYVTHKFENNGYGLAQKDAKSRELAAAGWSVISEQIEQGHRKGGEQCCLFMICIPLVFAAGRTPSMITVTYGRDLTAVAARALVGGLAACLHCGATFDAKTNYCDCCGNAVEKPRPPLALSVPATKACPFCAERINAQAKKCRFCGEFLNEQSEEGPSL